MNRSWVVRGVAVIAASLLGAVGAHAQVFTPTFMSPRLTNDVGIYVSDGPGDLSIEGIWRGGPFGIRAGYADVGDGALMLGGELRNQIRLQGAPIGLAFTAGAQGIFGDANAVGVQAGFSAGFPFTPEGANVTITPYLHPRLALVDDIGGTDEDDLDLEVLADFGVNLDFAPNLSLRFGVNLGHGADWGVGVAWRQ